MVGQHRSVQRRKIVENTYRTGLATRLRAMSRKHPRRGWRKANAVIANHAKSHANNSML